MPPAAAPPVDSTPAPVDIVEPAEAGRRASSRRKPSIRSADRRSRAVSSARYARPVTAAEERAAMVALLRTAGAHGSSTPSWWRSWAAPARRLQHELAGRPRARRPGEPPPGRPHKPGRPRNQARTDLERWDAQGMRLVTVLDPGYPPNLRAVHDRPPILFIAGHLTPTTPKPWQSSAPEGHRAGHQSGQGNRPASRRRRLHGGLGPGRGHRHGRPHRRPGQNGRTVAVIGTGLARAYPPQNRALQHQIAQQCAVVSQFWPDAPPTRRSFPMRNAVMSGIALATVVVEASETSGARTQARLALAPGRPVFLADTLVERQPWAREIAQRPGTQVIPKPRRDHRRPRAADLPGSLVGVGASGRRHRRRQKGVGRLRPSQPCRRRRAERAVRERPARPAPRARRVRHLLQLHRRIRPLLRLRPRPTDSTRSPRSPTASPASNSTTPWPATNASTATSPAASPPSSPRSCGDSWATTRHAWPEPRTPTASISSRPSRRATQPATSAIPSELIVGELVGPTRERHRRLLSRSRDRNPANAPSAQPSSKRPARTHRPIGPPHRRHLDHGRERSERRGGAEGRRRRPHSRGCDRAPSQPRVARERSAHPRHRAAVRLGKRAPSVPNRSGRHSTAANFRFIRIRSPGTSGRVLAPTGEGRR